MNKVDELSSFVVRQVVQIHEGNFRIFYRKAKKLLKFLYMNLSAPSVVRLGINWLDGYYFVLGQLLKKREKMILKPGLDKKLHEKIKKIENQINCYIEKYIVYEPDLSNVPAWISSSNVLFNISNTKESFEKALGVLRNVEKVRRQIIKNHQLDELDIEFVPRALAVGSIGAWENLEVYIKAGILGLRAHKKLVLLLDSKSRVNNPCYLNYWRKYITIISDSSSIQILSELEKSLTTPFTYYMSFNDKTMLSPAALGMVRKKWDAERRPPLLILSHEDNERGWRCLNSFGVPKDAWFVCLHVREQGWHGDGYSGNFRNADIDTYFLAIRVIVDAGGWIVRMGDSGMKPLPEMDHVIDYAHSEMKSDWMDVFLCATCRFMIGTSSGMHTLSLAFGTPVIMTNCLQAEAMYQFAPNVLFIPRICQHKNKNIYISFHDFICPPILTANNQYAYDRLDIKVIENTSEEIRDVVMEMLARLNGTIQYSEEDESLQDQFKLLTARCGEFYGGNDITVNARIGRDFLRKYAALLPAETKIESFIEK